jgi:hypothetical protein
MQAKIHCYSNLFIIMFSLLSPSLRYVYQWLSFTGFGRNPLLDIEDKYTDPVKVPVYLSEPVPVEIERV